MHGQPSSAQRTPGHRSLAQVGHPMRSRLQLQVPWLQHAGSQCLKQFARRTITAYYFNTSPFTPLSSYHYHSHPMLPLVLLIASLRAYTGSKTSYTNPVVDVNSPDPGVLGTADGYVAVTSSGYMIENNVFPIRSSRNLVDWRVQGAVFPNKTAPAWAAPPFYAPEIHAIVDGSNGGGTTTYFCVYDATEVATGVMAIGIAWAASPTGPFTDSGQPLMRGTGSANASAIDATLWQPTTREQGTSNVGSTSVSTSGYSSTQMFLAFKNKDNGVRKIMLQELEWTHKRQHGSTGGDGGDGTTSVKAVGDPGTILTSTEAWEGKCSPTLHITRCSL